MTEPNFGDAMRVGMIVVGVLSWTIYAIVQTVHYQTPRWKRGVIYLGRVVGFLVVSLFVGVMIVTAK